MKKVSENALTGNIGEDTAGLIIQRDLGFIWRPTPRVDVGYDGELEVRDKVTSEATGLIVKVQSKAQEKFDSETNEGFIYHCSEADIDYWTNSNVPDILVISRSRKEEVYWSPIKKYFELYPEDKKQKKIIFNKVKNLLNATSREEIARLAVSKDKGLYLAPLPKEENLFSNLIPIAWYPPKIYIAQSIAKDSKEVFDTLRQKFSSIPPVQWIVKNKMIISFDDLEKYEWDDIREKGTVEEFDSSEWADSEDPDKKREFVELISKNFSDKCWRLGLKFDRELKYYYFRPMGDEVERSVKYKGQSKNTSRNLITARYSKKEPGKIAYYRHLAFEAKFIKYDSKWYLEISPTYHMTLDGMRSDRFYAGRVSGMKKLQKNGNVLGEVIFLSGYIKDPINVELFKESDEFVKLGDLLKFKISGGIDETQWLIGDEEPEITLRATSYEEDDFMGLPLLETI